MAADEELLVAARPQTALTPSERIAKIRALVAAGAEVDGRGEYGFTALHRAVSAPSSASIAPPELDVIRCLLELGADVNAKNDIGVTPFDCAIALNDTDPPETIARSKEVLELLASRGARPSAVRGPVAHYTCCERSLYELLLRVGDGDVRARNERGDTPLHGAVHAVRPKIVELLLERDVDLDATNDQGKTPLGLAKKLSEYTPEQQRAKAQIVAMLEARGAKARAAIEKKPGTTPVDDGELLRARDRAQLAPGVARLFDDTFDTYEELIGQLVSTLDPESYLPALAVCAEALGGEQSTRTLAGDQVVQTAGFHHGDFVVDGHLRIVAPFAVTGSLIVTGCVTDCGPDSKVIVLGDVKVGSLYTCGEFHVRGAIDADGVVYGFYNDNTLSAATIRARLVIEDEHATQADVESPHHFDLDRYQQGAGEGVVEELRALLVPEVFYPDDDDDYPGQLDKERLFGRIENREPVFR